MAGIKQVLVGGKLYGLAGANLVNNRNILCNGDLTNPINLRGQSSYEMGGSAMARDLTCWRGMNVSLNLTGGVMAVTASDSTEGYKRIQHVVDEPIMSGVTLTASILLLQVTKTDVLNFRIVDGSSAIGSMVVPEISTPTILTLTRTLTKDCSLPGVELLSANKSNAGWSATFTAVKLEFGEDSTLANDPPADPAVNLWRCQRYFQLYASASARPTSGVDCRPVMRTDAPTQGTVTINGTTYYYNSSEL